MKKMSVLMVLSLVAVASASPVGIYFDDDFSGTALNPSTWNTYTVGGASVTVSNSNVYVAASSNMAQLTSVASVAPGTGQTVTLTGTNVGLSDAWPNEGMSWGFSGGPNLYWTKYGQPGGWTYGAYLDMGGKSRWLWGYGSSSWSSIKFDWSADKVTVYQNGSLVFDSSDLTNYAPYEGGSWTIPTSASNVQASTYVNGLTFSFDRLKLEVVPEPATIGLLGLGILGLIRKRG